MQKLVLLVTAFLARPSGRYLLIGGGVYVLELLIIALAQYGLHTSPVTAVALSFIIGTAVSFGLHKWFTFGDKRMHHKVVLSQAVAVTLLVVFNFGFTVLATKLLQNVLPTIVTRTLALLTTTIWNFFLYKTRIFKKTDIELIT